jgi:hypothetical protein
MNANIFNNKWFWIIVGFILAAAIIPLSIFSQKVNLDDQGYSALFILFGAIGAWITGIALFAVAYQQWKLRQREHSLLYNPRIALYSASDPKDGQFRDEEFSYSYRIEWTILIQNASLIPVTIRHMQMDIQNIQTGNIGGISGDRQQNSFIYEPASLAIPFQVLSDRPQLIRWFLTGSAMADLLEDISGKSDQQRDFRLSFLVEFSTPQNPHNKLTEKITSQPLCIPQNAHWAEKVRLSFRG